MESTITPDIVIAYAQCPRKAYLLLFSPGQGKPHEYIRIREWQQRENHERYLDRLRQKHTAMQPYTVENLGNGSTVLLNASLQADGFAAVCDVLTRVKGTRLNLSSKMSFALSWESPDRGDPQWRTSTHGLVPMPSFGTARRARCRRWKK